jgi:integrative and conjugative element protein (TIGR02256 family)
MQGVSSLEFISDDQKFGIRIEDKEIFQILRICRAARNIEVGGIIVGTYDSKHRYALVKTISDAPPDSLKDKDWFQRGIENLQDMLNYFWDKKQCFYLGEWHFHPNNSAQASSLDIKQMQKISTSKSFNCPEPILIILGGNPSKDWDLSAYVFPCNQMWIRLKENKRTCIRKASQ